ncbi:unnamed protein product [Allacma fusca]|uniref:Protein Skeletor n=1 Tax=Allacma fusca TaxID=39272 RepID=A0A8J2PTS9_9HEXA|nr:unnamed protein product [Allacma fusca]
MGAYWNSVKPLALLLCTVIFTTANGTPTVSLSGAGNLFRGKYIGRLAKREHKVSGEVYAVDARTIHIRGFNYDGAGPDAFFWTGFTEHPSPQGIIIPNERGTKEVLGAYNNQDITITLPDGLTLRDVKWLAVWCRAFEVNFGDVPIPADLDYPQPHVLGSLAGQHDVSSGPIVVVDAQTILLPDFTYDGQAPDVHFWVGRGKPAPEGIRVPDETGGDTPLVKSDKKTMVLSLPGDLTIFDIDYFGVWCRLYYVDFGHVKVPKNLNVPPSLKMLGVTPQTKLNCEVLYDDLALEVRWAVAGESVVMQLVGKIDQGDYMSFGLSGDDSRSEMVGGDVVVGWFDKSTQRGHVVDYFLDSKSQCSGRRGTCPDSRLQQAGSNNVRLLSAAVVNGFTMLTFQRPIKAHDELDKNILTNGSQPVIWAVGPINQRQEASYHKVWNKEDLFIEFGRTPKWNCPAPEEQTSQTMTPTAFPAPVPASNLQNQPSGSSNKQQQQHHTQTLVTPQSPVQKDVAQYLSSPAKSPVQLADTSNRLDAWRVPPILCHEPEDRVFYAQMGPTGGKRGYSAITGQVGWGISWYINGLLVPEIYVVRGKTYTFVVEGGNDPEVPANYHPFYITDDSQGGYQHKPNAEKRNVRVFAGVGVDSKGETIPTATGRLCRWAEGEHSADTFGSYGAYQRSLSLHCDDGHPGILHWTPDENTPDLVYYQCYTHRYLGWKIHVVDSCESGGEPSADSSENVPSRQSLADQEVGESVQETASVLVANSNHIKRPTAEGNPIDSGEARVQSVADASNGKSKLPEHKSSLDKSQLNEKQEAVIPVRTTATVAPAQVLLATRPEHTSQYRRPLTPGTVQFTPSGYLHVPQGNIGLQRPGIPAHPQYGQVQFPQEGHTLIRNPESHHPYLSYTDHYGQRIVDNSGLIYEPRPGLDYFVGPTGRPAMALAHPIRYDGVPAAPLIYASTIAPQILTSTRQETPGNPTGGKILESQTIQGPLIRLKQPTVSPVALSSENVKYVDFLAPNYRLPTEGVVRGRPHSRNLPKREQLRNLGKEATEEIRMGLRSIGAEDVGDDSTFEIIKINDTGNLPFELPKEETAKIPNGTIRTPSSNLQTARAAARRQHQPNSDSQSSQTGETPVTEVYHAAEASSQGSQTMDRGAGVPGTRNNGIRSSFSRGNHMSKKFKDDAELDVVHTKEIPHEDMKITGKFQSINPEALTKPEKKPIAGQREKDQKTHGPGFDPHSVVPESGGFKPVLSEYNEESTDDKTQYELPTPSASSASLQTDQSAHPEQHRPIDAKTDRNDERGFKIPELTSLQPVFRPSPQDNFPKVSTSTRAATSPMQIIELPSNVIQKHYGARYPFQQIQGKAPFVRREYMTLQQESHPRPFQPQAPLFKLDESGRKKDLLIIKDLNAAANEHTPSAYFPQQQGNPHRLPTIPRLPPTHPGAILTYDGRPVDVSNGGISLRPSADLRTPSILHKPQFGTFRGEFPPPVPEFVPENLPQLGPQRGSTQQQHRRIPSQPTTNQKPNLVPAASFQTAVRVSPPLRPAVKPYTSWSTRTTTSSSKLEIIPNDDVAMVLVKAAEDQDIREELPKILQQLGSEFQADENNDQDENLRNHQQTRLSSQESSLKLAQDEIKRSAQEKDLEQNRQHQNSTDLHILTDIWSIINQDEATRIQSRRHFPASSQRSSVSPKETNQGPIHNEPVVARRQKRSSPALDSSRSEKSHQKRSADHGGHHDDDDHTHHHHANAGSSLLLEVYERLSPRNPVYTGTATFFSFTEEHILSFSSIFENLLRANH